MKKMKRTRSIWLAAAITSLVAGVAALALVFVFASKILYAPLIISLLVTAHAAYGTPYYFIAYSNMKLIEKIAAAIDGGAIGTSEISAAVGIDSGACEKLLAKAKRKNYITDSTESENNKT